MPVDVLGGTAIRPIQREGWEAISFFLYDKSTGAIMGRTPKSWALIIGFYIIYYILLAAFWALCMFVFFKTIDDTVPKWTTDESLIGTSGALGIRPNQSDEFIDSSMIIFNQAAEGKTVTGGVAGWKEWAERTNKFLEEYRTSKGVDCTSEEPGPGKFCKFPLESLGPCGQDNFGYDLGKPCIYLKMNKIYGLTHSYYNDTADLPEELPTDLKLSMAKLTGEELNQIWVNCHPENPADKEGLGDIEYFPKSAGFHDKYFPFKNQANYLGPLVAVQFQNPTAGQLLHIECRAYAKNILYSKRDKLGIAHFELLIHNEATAKKADAEL